MTALLKTLRAAVTAALLASFGIATFASWIAAGVRRVAVRLAETQILLTNAIEARAGA